MQKKIVVVDDDPCVQDAARIIFERAGYNALILPGPQPLYEMEHTDADILLLDRQLGGYDGLEVCKELKKRREFAHVPVLIMSATSHLPVNIENTMANGFIDKPFRKKELLAQIEELLSVTSAEAAL